MTRAQTFPELLAERLRSDPGQPLITAYDDATGERTELSVTTYANWVSKTANLLADELGLDEGDTVLLDLPPHWLVPVFLGAAWSAGLTVTTSPLVEHRLVVCGPWVPEEGPGPLSKGPVSGGPSQPEVLACSLRPFAVRFPDPLPTGVIDYGLAWPGQSDVFVALVPPAPESSAWIDPDRSQADLLAEAADQDHTTGVRLLTDVHPASEQGVPVFLVPLVHGGSVVLVRHPDEQKWPARLRDERATVGLRAADQPPSV